jgi:predicted solute-binding protein
MHYANAVAIDGNYSSGSEHRDHDLYVNDWTLDLGVVGQESLDALSQRARQVGILPAGTDRLEVLQQH